MRKLIARKSGLYLQDRVTGSHISRTLPFLRESQSWDQLRMHNYQLNKLKKIVHHASKNIPYYKELFERIGFTYHDIKSLEDIQKIPILTKDILRREGDRMLSKHIDLQNVKVGKTGGTTGVPTKVYKDANSRSFTWASYYRWYDWMGLHHYDPTVTFWGAKTVLSSSIADDFRHLMTSFVQNNLILDSFNMTEQVAISYYKKISRRTPYLIKGYTSSLLEFANFVEKYGWTFPKLKALSTTTETLMPSARKYLERIFGVPVYDQYGCGEVAAISYECNAHMGLHVNQEHVICEILDADDRMVVGKSGRVVVTDLDNFAMPFLRYENGDYATLSDEKCSCTVNSNLMKSIEGRSTDTITLKNGQKVHGVFFTDIFYELGIFSHDFPRFQIRQDSLNYIDFLLETSYPLDPSIKEKLQTVLCHYIENVNFQEVTKIAPESNGKFRYIVSTLN